MQQSLPSWERGLKSKYITTLVGQGAVAPLVGAWIEMCIRRLLERHRTRRSPRGSVD